MECKYTLEMYSILKNRYADETWGRDSNEIKNIRETCRNKSRGFVTAALLWHIWLERNSRVFVLKHQNIACICHRINNVIDL